MRTSLKQKLETLELKRLEAIGQIATTNYKKAAAISGMPVQDDFEIGAGFVGVILKAAAEFDQRNSAKPNEMMGLVVEIREKEK